MTARFVVRFAAVATDTTRPRSRRSEPGHSCQLQMPWSAPGRAGRRLRGGWTSADALVRATPHYDAVAGDDSRTGPHAAPAEHPVPTGGATRHGHRAARTG